MTILEQFWLELSVDSNSRGNVKKNISINNRGFLYADGFFTTILISYDVPQLLKLHLQRIKHSCQQLSILIGEKEVELISKEITLLAQNYHHAICKVVITRVQGTRGYYSANNLPEIYIQLSQISAPQNNITNKNSKANDCIIVHVPIETDVLTEQMGIRLAPLRGLKLLACNEQIFLSQCAHQQNLTEALVFNFDNVLTEGLKSNIFYYAQGQWHTPALNNSGIHGVQRQYFIDQMQKHNITPNLSEHDPSIINKIESLFFCNALGITPAKSLCGRILNTQNVDNLLRQLYATSSKT